MSLISAASISLDSTFNYTVGYGYGSWYQAWYPVHSVKDKIVYVKMAKAITDKRTQKRRKKNVLLRGGRKKLYVYRKSYLSFDSEEVCHGFSQGAIAH
jgi:hypothetical protein